MKKKIWIPALAGGILLIAVAWFMTADDTSAEETLLVKPQYGKFTVSVTTTGELQAKNSIEIQGPANARIAQIWQMKVAKLIPEGTVVKAGEFVAELDKSELAGKIREAELAIQKAQSQYTQTRLDTTLSLTSARDDLANLKYALEEKKLVKEQSIYEAPSVQRQAEIDYEKSERAYAQAQTNYKTKVQQAVAKMSEVSADLAKEQQKMGVYMEILQQFTITAPADGMVIYAKEWNGRKKVIGSTISAWDPVVATLPDLSIMESVTYVNEVDIQKVRNGQEVILTLDAVTDKKLKGKITEVANIGEQRPNSDSKVFEVKILIDTKDTTLRPAMTTGNEIITAIVDKALYIPLESIHTEDGFTYVFKKDGASAVKQEVQIGLMNDNEVIIEKGLTQKDEVYLSIPPDSDKLGRVSLNGTASGKPRENKPKNASIGATGKRL
jgi:hypothetical protein